MLVDTSVVCKEKHHENEPLNYFCKQCKVCICDKCGLTRHNHHTKMDIHQAAREHKGSIEEITEDMKKEIADFQMHVERTKESLTKSREKIATARNKAMTSLEELMRVLKEHETATVASLDVIEEKEKRGHAAQLEHFQISIDQLQSSVEHCEAITQRNNSIEILQAHQALVERCRGLLNAEKLNIYKPLHTRYEINEQFVENVKGAVPGRIAFCYTDPLQSVAEGKGLQEADVGTEAQFVITTKDSDGKQCYDDDDQIIVKVQTPSREELNHKIKHDKDGEYSVAYTPDCVGQHALVIAVNGQPLTGSPWRVRVSPHRYKSVFSFGSCACGKAQGQFDGPLGIAISDKTGNVAVADCFNNRVQLFSSEGKNLSTISDKKVIKPTSVAFTRSGELIVIASAKMFYFNCESGKLVNNSTNKHLKLPFDLTITRDGRMVVCDHGDSSVKVLSSDGMLLLLTIRGLDRARSAVCHQDMIVISYYIEDNVKVFSKDGVFLHSIGTPGSGDGQLNGPDGLATDRFGHLVVCDYYNRRLQMFTFDGKFVSTLAGQHTGLRHPYSVAVSTTGQLFVTDREKNCVHVFQ